MDILNVTEATAWVTEPIPGYVRLADIFIIIIYFVATIIGKLLMLFIQSYNKFFMLSILGLEFL